jgi:hypothetical protein
VHELTVLGTDGMGEERVVQRRPELCAGELQEQETNE